MKYSHYLFDFDGTLVDSMPAFASVMLNILDQHKIDYPADVVKIITPLGYVGTARYFQEELGLDLPEEKIILLMKDYILDDNYNADRTARAAGMKACGVYDDSSRDYVDEMKAVADHYIYDFSELLAL